MSGKGKGPNRARAVAAEKLAQQRAAEKRRRTMIVGITSAVVLALAVAISIAVFNAQKPDTVAVPRNATSTGVTVGKAGAKLTIDVYFDYLCPICRRFETEAGPTLDKLAADGKAQVVYHPIAILDRASTTKYSTRASSAGGCVADSAGPDAFAKFSAAMFDQQPAEGGAGLPDSELKKIAAQAGAGGAASCIEDGRYKDWATDLTDASSRSGVTGTPTVKVNGVEVPQPVTLAGLNAAVEKAGQ